MSAQFDRDRGQIRPEDIARALGDGKEFRNGDGSWNTVCPAHADKGPSLTVSLGQSGKILVHCHAGCHQADVIDALKKHDLWPRPRREWEVQNFAPEGRNLPASINHPRLGVALKSWEYRDEKGRLVGAISRFDKQVGDKVIKELAPLVWGKDKETGKEQWCWKGFNKPRPLYGAHVLKDHPRLPVLLVEGEKTADAARLIFGTEYLVLTWPGGGKAVKYANWELLRDRDVVVWRDYDEPGEKAQTQVCEILLQVGVNTLRIVDLPMGLPHGWDLADPIPDGINLDPHALVRAAASYYAQSTDIVDEYNKQFAVVLVGDKAVIMWEKPEEIVEAGQPKDAVVSHFISTAAFNTIFGNQYVTVGRREEPAPKVWMQSPNRRTYQGVAFAPGLELKRDYNLWRGFKYDPDPDGDFSLFAEHILENVSSGDESLANWIWAWFAQMVQQPRQKPGTSLAIRGRQGTGKTVVGQHMGKLIGQHYILVDDSRYVTGQFNSHQASALLMHADEAFFAGDPRHIGRLKGMVTSSSNMIEHKGKDPITVANYMRLLITSNEGFVVPAAFEERRFGVIDCGEGRIQQRPYFRAMEQQLLNGGYEGLLHHLQHLDISTVDVGIIPASAALAEQKLHSMAPVHRFWYERLRDGEIMPGRAVGWPDRFPVETLYQAYVRRTQDWGERRRVSEIEFGKELRLVVPGGELERKKMTAKVVNQFGETESVRTWGYCLPHLDTCRRAFDDALGSKSDWPRISDDDKESEDQVPF